MNTSMGNKMKRICDKWWRYLPLLFTFHFSLLTTSCGVGDDNGERLGDYIVGTWQRGWGPGDVIIEGIPEGDDSESWTPESFDYDKFIFHGDGTYNGMVRTGTFCILGTEGDTIFVGDYKCDNSNLRLDLNNQDGLHQTILALVKSFTEKTMVISYEAEEISSGLRVQMTLRKEE